MQASGDLLPRIAGALALDDGMRGEVIQMLVNLAGKSDLWVDDRLADSVEVTAEARATVASPGEREALTMALAIWGDTLPSALRLVDVEPRWQMILGSLVQALGAWQELEDDGYLQRWLVEVTGSSEPSRVSATTGGSA